MVKWSLDLKVNGLNPGWEDFSALLQYFQEYSAPSSLFNVLLLKIKYSSTLSPRTKTIICLKYA